MVIALVVVFILFCGLTDGRLLYAQNMSNLMLQNGYVLVLACGMLLCILTGGNIDLSVGAVICMVGGLAAVLTGKGMNAYLTIIICLIGYPFGYFMAKLSDKWKKRAMIFLMLPFWVNSLIRLYGWMIILQTKGLLNHVLKSLGLIEKPLRILYSYPAIVVGMTYVLVPFMILSVYSSAEKLDWSLVEAARDLGASPMKAFWTISFKLTLPGLLSGVILTFIPSMGLFFIADILGGNKIVLVGSLIQEQMTKGNNWPFAAALAVVLMILTTLMIMLYRKVTNAKELEGVG